MDTTPVSKMKQNLKTSKPDCSNGDEDSPGYFPMTQESFEGIDVSWDWNSSPQATEKKPRRRKRLLAAASPKVPLKRHPSYKHNFDKLKGELEALKEQLAAIPDEDCLSVSPAHECEIKNGSHLEINYYDDLFDDAVDQQLVLFSQKIESELNNIDKNAIMSSNENNRIDHVINKYNKKEIFQDDLDDSLDCVLEAIKDDDIEILTQRVTPRNVTNNNASLQSHNMSKINNLLKGDIYRARSFEASEIKEIKPKLIKTKSFEQETNSKDKLTIIDLNEIERKRKEALAKLEMKRKLENSESQKTISKNCTLEEIERKRLQALAKLKEKRMDEIVQKNRQEALKRLEKSRLKHHNKC